MSGSSASLNSLNTQESFMNKKKEIILPKQKIEIDDIAVDIGGSLAKVVYLSKQQTGARLEFCKFETSNIDQLIGFLQGLITTRDKTKIKELFKEKLKGVQIQREDEMDCLISGLNFLVRQIDYEVFTYDERRPDPMQFEKTTTEIFPYLLVNIGSGVSIIKVTSNDNFERISGTSLGGGTLWGLLGLLTDAKDYDEMLEMSKKGDNSNVDMLVGDIYGGDYNKIGLKSTTIASSFGKVIKVPPGERKTKFRQEDIAVSLLYLVSNNIGQIAYLNAQAHGIERIYFSGFYLSGHAISMNTLSYSISYWSKGKIQANFLRHEGYLGAVGAFLKDPENVESLGSFTENFSQNQSENELYSVGSLEEYTKTGLRVFPLLMDPSTYNPDTLDLTKDAKLNAYWIDLLDANLHHLIELVLQRTPDAENRAHSFEEMYRHHLQELRQKPKAYGALSVRSLLNLREQCLRQMGFNDIFYTVKQTENNAAFEQITAWFEKLDLMEEGALVNLLLENILAGNMLDWGSTLIQEMFLKRGFDFETAKSKLQFSPGFSNRNVLQERLLAQKPYHKCLIFVDNSGADIFFGILPFARYLLKKGTRIVLAANTHPSVNDITAAELQEIVDKIVAVDKVFADAVNSGKIEVIQSGSGSPCLDFLRISDDLCKASIDVDFVVIEGMGRAIHTNFYASFKVDSVKIGVFKNPQIAEYLGAQLYEGMVIYTPA